MTGDAQKEHREIKDSRCVGSVENQKDSGFQTKTISRTLHQIQVLVLPTCFPPVDLSTYFP